MQPPSKRPRLQSPTRAVADSAASQSTLSSAMNNASLTSAKSMQDLDTLKTFTDTLQGFRQELTCKICFRLLYEPFTNPCGHTFCYSCLSQWFDNNANGNGGRRKTCPDCRAIVSSAPAPSYAIRELTSRFIQQVQWLGDETETAEQHAQWKSEEAEAVERDKNNQDPRNGGLFKGRFKPRFASALHHALRDVEDGVDRCPHCHWEIEDPSGRCLQCGEIVDSDFSEDDSEDDEGEFGSEDEAMALVAAELGHGDDSDFDDEDDMDAELAMEMDANDDFSTPETGVEETDQEGRRFTARLRSTTRLDDEEDEEEDSLDEDDPEMEGFIDDEDFETDSASESESSMVTAQPEPPPHRRSRGSRQSHPYIVDSDSETGEGSSSDVQVTEEPDEHDTDDEPPIASGRRRPRR